VAPVNSNIARYATTDNIDADAIEDMFSYSGQVIGSKIAIQGRAC
jgi:hypothetical protein